MCHITRLEWMISFSAAKQDFFQLVSINYFVHNRLFLLKIPCFVSHDKRARPLCPAGRNSSTYEAATISSAKDQRRFNGFKRRSKERTGEESSGHRGESWDHLPDKGEQGKQAKKTVLSPRCQLFLSLFLYNSGQRASSG